MEYVAIDFETANPDMASICQVGVVRFKDGLPVASWSTHVNPGSYFDDIHTSIHGIDESTVAGAPEWHEAHAELEQWMRGSVVVSHTSFDRLAFNRACTRSAIDAHECRWIDSSRVTRRAWPEFAYSGYGLKNVASHLGIEFQHHDAQEDARAAGEILARAIAHSGFSLEDWLVRSHQSLSEDAGRMKFDGNPEGSLYGETLVFTGALLISRGEASKMAADVGCNVEPGVTKRTTILVVGDQDIQKLAGNEKSSKHRKAESLVGAGQPIRIVGESDFAALVQQSR